MTETDPRFINPSKLDTLQECDEATFALDNTIASMKNQIEYAKCEGTHEESWFVRIQFSLDKTKATRNAVQNRRSVIKRTEDSKRRTNIETLFMEAAQKVLPKEWIDRVWDYTHRNNPTI